MIQQKMIVDVAHLNEAGFEDVYQLCRQAKYPFVCSHGNCRALCDDPRNLSDTQLRAIGEVNGMIGIFGAAKFVSSDPHANIHHLIHHISHARLKVGDENVGIGSDFGGISKVLDGFEAVSSFNHLAGKLYKRGFKKWQVEQTLSENWLNFYRRIWSK
jgi:membrane dipeptidase